MLNTSQSSGGLQGRASSRCWVSWKECGKQWWKEAWGNRLLCMRRGSLSTQEGDSLQQEGRASGGEKNSIPGKWGCRLKRWKICLQKDPGPGLIHADPHRHLRGLQEASQHGHGRWAMVGWVYTSEFSGETKHVCVCTEIYLKELANVTVASDKSEVHRVDWQSGNSSRSLLRSWAQIIFQGNLSLCSYAFNTLHEVHACYGRWSPLLKSSDYRC